MSFELILFNSDLDTLGILNHDTSGWSLVGHPATHSSGRKGIGFTIPDGTNQGHGCRIIWSKNKKVTINQKGILFLRTSDWESLYPWGPGQQAALAVDDFTMQDEKVCPEIPPEPIPTDSPLDIIKEVYATGAYELVSKEGCGLFTEACCKELHDQHSKQWGHIRKFGPQNQYNGHAVDAIMLLSDVTNQSGTTKAGIYDIIINSESVNAKPQFIFKGPPDNNLWYYPA